LYFEKELLIPVDKDVEITCKTHKVEYTHHCSSCKEFLCEECLHLHSIDEKKHSIETKKQYEKIVNDENSKKSEIFANLNRILINIKDLSETEPSKFIDESKTFPEKFSGALKTKDVKSPYIPPNSFFIEL